MTILLTDTTRCTGKAAERFITDKYSLPQRVQMLAKSAEACPRHWQDMADLGWLAAPLPELVGGLGLIPAQLVPMLGVLGAGLILEPYGPAILHCATTLAQMLPAAQAPQHWCRCWQATALRF